MKKQEGWKGWWDAVGMEYMTADGPKPVPMGYALLPAEVALMQQKIAELEARKQIFVGTEEEIAKLCENGTIRIGDIAITQDEETNGTDLGGDTDTGADVGTSGTAMPEEGQEGVAHND